MTAEGSEVPHVVVGVDSSAESVAALSWAARYATATGATVRAVLAWHYPTVAGMPPTGLTSAPVSEEVEQRVRIDLAEAVAKVYPKPEPNQVEAVMRYGHPAEVLIDESASADLLVVGSHGHGAFTGMLVGSVSIHCVTSAHCPVVVVRGS